MLSVQSINIIKSTVPVLEVHGVTITKRFYELLFTNHPELLNLFNHANQKQGRQQAALANTVYAAALHIENLSAIIPVVKQIGHKHRSLGVKPEHYPVVGKYLLMAIKDVLGDAATDDILNAWAEAYGIIADAFISIENEMYEEAHTAAGGWEGFRSFRVERMVKESEVISSFYLVPEDGGAIAAFKPGQYVSVKINQEGAEHTQIRQYSLSASSGKPYYRISVKREDGDQDRAAGAVSTYLHQCAAVGTPLLLSAPAGDFTLNLEDERPVVLLSGGVGLTPMLSMLHTLVEQAPKRPVTFIHAAQNGDFHALREEVDALASEHPQLAVYYCYNNPTKQDLEQQRFHKTGYVDLPWLQSVIKDAGGPFYFCGPLPFMTAMNRSLKQWGIPEADIHFEFFGPAASLEPAVTV
ncbi:nitric oxide dioxygenase [Paenibacillus sp. FSL H8-0548]|uniref:NO-inducible flavohemoprotein n=1 Tax=Paenibacillus sp. FSL H8-0548 TaxID=1920422 RepID=UPI00096E4A51|nr:NO-inducible flavohemoprotein [Paenibacillus sp. FSL H8-0548]OMF37245.1 nitric oxide dioxygenase [Paenibacillus sp. FSL H8-0548]